MRLNRALVASLVLSGITPQSTGAQLRPLDPMDWDAIDQNEGFRGSLGVGVYRGQRASLAGTEGSLLEVGAFRGSWGFDRVAIQLSGTALWVFHDDTVFAAPFGLSRPPTGEARVDAGDYALSTMVRLSGGDGPFDVALRFGVRLPITDNKTGLERDQTDFYSTVGGRFRSDGLFVSGEFGFGILGTRYEVREQIDPILYGLAVAWEDFPVRPEIAVVGQYDTRPLPNLRGNEDLSELSVSGTVGEHRWLKVAVVRGLQTFSPGFGLSIELGIGG